MKRIGMGLLAALALVFVPQSSLAERFITVSSTTSTENSGLFASLLPRFAAQTGIAVRVVAVGTGKAIRLAQNGDADVLFVHHKPSEEQFVAAGFGVKRLDVMYNDFVIVGPGRDPAGVRAMKDVVYALKSIAGAGALFASRGDDSGTHKKERSLWHSAGLDPSVSGGDWYRETGSGMGATLNVASGLDAYAMTDRATWLMFGNKGHLQLLVEGDKRLFNQYGITLVDKRKHPHIKNADAQRFIDWLVSATGQAEIDRYTIKGKQAFFANAKR